MKGEDEPKSKRNSIIKSKPSQMEMKRQNSFLEGITLIMPDIFKRGSQQKIEPFIPPKSQLLPKEEEPPNVFTGFRSQQTPKMQESRVNMTNSYERQCLQYQKYLFDSRIKTIIKRMAIKAYSGIKSQKQGQFYVFPIQKLLVAISKKMLLNRFQLLFLQYVFEETKWNYDIECIKRHVNHFKSYLMVQDSQIMNENVKMVQIYILYCAYFSKKSLNELSNDNMFLTFAQEVCPRFKELFSEWTQKLSIFAKINPKQLNAIFKRLTNISQRDQQQIENYCLIVEQIIDISPAYNADKSGKQKKSRKTKKESAGNKEEQKESENYNAGYESSHRHLQIIQQQPDSYDMPPLMQSLNSKPKNSSVLSVDLLEPIHYITRKSSQRSSNGGKF